MDRNSVTMMLNVVLHQLDKIEKVSVMPMPLTGNLAHMVESYMSENNLEVYSDEKKIQEAYDYILENCNM